VFEQLYQPKKESCSTSENFYFFKTKHTPLSKKCGKYSSKRQEKYTNTTGIPPATFVGGL